MDRISCRLRRAVKTRAKLSAHGVLRLSVHRTNAHIYAQIYSGNGAVVVASASTTETAVRAQIVKGSNIEAAILIGKRIAEKAKQAGVTRISFDRSGYRYHGRVRALADAARETGLLF